MKDEKFEQLKFFGQPVLFTPRRVKNEELPKGIYRYEVRHDDECKGIITEIAYGIMVNHWGTILSNKPIPLWNDQFRWIDEDTDIEFLNTSCTLKEYMRTAKAKNKER